jgi:hypothetical protein
LGIIYHIDNAPSGVGIPAGVKSCPEITGRRWKEIFMIAVKERLNLDEMARFIDAGIAIEVRSSDHGMLYKKNDPAHVHIFDISGNTELAQIILTAKPPEKPSDIQWYRTDNPPDGLGKAIVKFAGAFHKPSKKIGRNITNWDAVINQWIYFHGV